METQDQNFERNEEKVINKPGEGNQKENAPGDEKPEVIGDPSEINGVDDVKTDEDIAGDDYVDGLLKEMDDHGDSQNSSHNNKVVDNDLNTGDKNMGLNTDGDGTELNADQLY